MPTDPLVSEEQSVVQLGRSPGFRGLNPDSQWRYRGGFSPPSLFSPDVMYRGTGSDEYSVV